MYPLKTKVLAFNTFKTWKVAIEWIMDWSFAQLSLRHTAKMKELRDIIS